MDIGIVSVRYAKALLKYALEQKEENIVYNEMDTLSQVYLNTPELRQMIENPLLSNGNKMKILCKATGVNPCETTQNFFSLVIRKRRTTIMPCIANSYESLYLSYKNVVKSRLTVSSKPNDAFVDKMRELVEAKTDSKVEMQVNTDVSLGGGFILEYGTYKIDASIRNQIKNIRKKLMRTAGNS